MFRGEVGAGETDAADDRGEQVIEIMRDTAGEASDRFHFLRMPQLLFALAQRLLRRASLVHFADEIVALLEKFPGRARELPEFGVVARDPVGRFRIVFLETGHDQPERLADPAEERGVDQKQEHEGEQEQQEDQPFARTIQLLDGRHLIADDEVGERSAVPAIQGP